MDKKVIYNLTCGVFMLATKADGKASGCITNTCMQVASNPVRIIVSLLNTNYTCDLLKRSSNFTLSLLDEDATFETIKHFGFQSGRDVDKFAKLNFPHDKHFIPYLGWQASGVISAKVKDSLDLGSHTVFLAEVEDAKTLSGKAPLTYSDYQSHVKPKPEAVKSDKKIIAWRCKICGYVHEGAELPKDFTCPLCGHGPEDFEPVYEE